MDHAYRYGEGSTMSMRHVGLYNQPQYQQQACDYHTQQQPYHYHSNSYSEESQRHRERGGRSSSTENVAGFAARKFAHTQEAARRRAEQEQRQLAEAYERQRAEERQYHQMRWEEEQRSQRIADEEVRCRQGEYERRDLRQVELQNREVRQQQRQKSSSPLIRSSNARSPSGLHETSKRHEPQHSLKGLNLLKPIDQPPIQEGEHGAKLDNKEMEGDGFGGLMIFPEVTNRFSTSVEEELPKAKCADCGKKFPFEELASHFCNSNLDIFKSPLLSRRASTVGSSTPRLEDTPKAMARIRSPFLEKYAQIVETSSSPLLQSAGVPSSSRANSPLYTSSRLPEASPSTVESVRTTLQHAQQTDQMRYERLCQIEEQRAAKKMQASLPIAAAPVQSKKPSYMQTLHSKDLASISSTASSTKSSLLDFRPSNASSSEDMTPSTSLESVSSGGYRSARQKPSSPPEALTRKLPSASRITSQKRGKVDLGEIEGLLKDIHTSEMRSTDTQKADPSHAYTSTSTTRSTKLARKTCSVCLHTFGKTQPMIEKDGKMLCIDDYAEMYLERCRKCSRPVRDVGVRSQDGALPGLYHRDCFSCFRCNAAFEDRTFYVFDNSPYCSKHYHHLNGTTCRSCKEGIEGICRTVETGERYHTRCLTCQYDNGREFCKDTLTEYYLVKGRRLCEWHYEKVQKYLRSEGKETNTKASKRRTYIHTVEARKGKA